MSQILKTEEAFPDHTYDKTSFDFSRLVTLWLTPAVCQVLYGYYLTSFSCQSQGVSVTTTVYIRSTKITLLPHTTEHVARQETDIRPDTKPWSFCYMC